MFKKAERQKVFLKTALTGPSGSGKTLGALEMASGMVSGSGKGICVLDTENGSASLYADRFDFDTAVIRPPFTPAAYGALINQAVKDGYEVIIIDSYSHVWAGEGGVRDQKETLDEKPGSNQWSNWRKPKAQHQKLKDLVLQCPAHVILTLRSKQAYMQIEDGQKKKIVKVGMEPISEPDLEYEFTLVLDLDMEHNASASKDRTELFDGKLLKISREVGAELMSWRAGAKAEYQAPPEIRKQPSKPTTSKPTQKSAPSKPVIQLAATADKVPGQHTIECGRKYQHKTIQEAVDKDGLPSVQKYLHWLESENESKGFPPSADIKAFRVNLDAFSDELKVNHEPEFKDSFDDSAYDAAKAAP